MVGRSNQHRGRESIWSSDPLAFIVQLATCVIVFTTGWSAERSSVYAQAGLDQHDEVTRDAALLAEVALDLRGGHPVIQALLLGEQRRLIVDTGASTTVVMQSLRSELGEPIRQIIVNTNGRKVEAEVFDREVMTIGGREFSGLVCVSHSPTFFDEAFMIQPPVVGLLGIDCLKEYVLELNPTDKVMRVYDRVPDDVAQNSESFKIKNVNGHWILQGNLPGMLPLVVSEDYVLDSGHEAEIVLQAKRFDELAASRRIENFSSAEGASLAGMHVTQTGQLQGFSLGQFHHRGINVTRGYTQSVIGWNYLIRFITVIDFPRKNVYLRPSVYFASQHEPAKSELLLNVNETGFSVLALRQNGPPEKAGLRIGDNIQRVNGKLAKEYIRRELTDLLSCDGENVRIGVSRNGMPVDIEVQLQNRANATKAEAKLLAEATIDPDCHVVIPVHRPFSLGTGNYDTTFNLSFRKPVDTSVPIEVDSPSSGKLEGFAYTQAQLEKFRLMLRSVMDGDFSIGELSGLSDIQFDGALGFCDLYDFVVEVDLTGNSLRLYDRLPDQVAESSQCFSMWFDDGAKTVGGVVAGEEYEMFRVDITHGTTLALRQEVYRKLASSGKIYDCKTTSFLDASGVTVTTESGILRQFQLGPFKNKELLVYPSEKSSIGLNYLRRYVAVFDLPRMQIYLRESAAFDKPVEPQDASGLDLTLQNDRVIVNVSFEQSPAREVGLAIGDQILEVNNKTTKEYSLYDLRELLKRQGETVKLVVRRGDNEPFTVEFMLKDYRKYLPDAKVDAAGDVDFNP